MGNKGEKSSDHVKKELDEFYKRFTAMPRALQYLSVEDLEFLGSLSEEAVETIMGNEPRRDEENTSFDFALNATELDSMDKILNLGSGVVLYRETLKTSTFEYTIEKETGRVIGTKVFYGGDEVKIES